MPSVPPLPFNLVSLSGLARCTKGASCTDPSPPAYNKAYAVLEEYQGRLSVSRWMKRATLMRSDAVQVGDKVTRRSTSGNVILFAGEAVLWKSKRQRCIVLSSMEAEYVAASETAKSIVWMDQLLKDVSVISDEKMPTLYINNNQVS